ncbi:hypothetical protein F5Y19DRAFT_474315 [Xylariaceae sp. FL1651]|nr:hypothetical protein F5Y19DRAFT_474315 [Xylariaceae sp. FL1651]
MAGRVVWNIFRDGAAKNAKEAFTRRQLEYTVKADAYFFRSTFHNWVDKHCIKILRNLVPALKLGAKIIIDERILPGLEELDNADAMRAINLDIGMQQVVNAQQRELREWPELFRSADPRFHWVGAYLPNGAIRWIIEAEWQDEDQDAVV